MAPPEGKEKPEGKVNIVGCFVVPLLWFCSPGITGNLTVSENGKGLPTTSIQILADEVHTCRAQVVVPTSSFIQLQNQVSGAF